MSGQNNGLADVITFLRGADAFAREQALTALGLRGGSEEEELGRLERRIAGEYHEDDFVESETEDGKELKSSRDAKLETWTSAMKLGATMALDDTVKIISGDSEADDEGDGISKEKGARRKLNFGKRSNKSSNPGLQTDEREETRGEGGYPNLYELISAGGNVTDPGVIGELLTNRVNVQLPGGKTISMPVKVAELWEDVSDAMKCGCGAKECAKCSGDNRPAKPKSKRVSFGGGNIDAHLNAAEPMNSTKPMHTERHKLEINPLFNSTRIPQEKADTHNNTHKGGLNFRWPGFDYTEDPAGHLYTRDTQPGPGVSHGPRDDFESQGGYNVPHNPYSARNFSNYSAFTNSAATGRNYSSEQSFANQIKGRDLSKIIMSWNLKFGGSTSENIEEFLTRVEECNRVAALSDAELLRAIPMLLSHSALNVFRVNGDSWKTWQDAVRELRAVYGDDMYSEKIMDQIRSRTQGEDESAFDFLTAMRLLFGKLHEPIPENVQVQRMYRNLRAEYLTVLRPYINSGLKEFVARATDFDKAFNIARHYAAPPPPEKSLIREAAYTQKTADIAPVSVPSWQDVSMIVAREMEIVKRELFGHLREMKFTEQGGQREVNNNRNNRNNFYGNGAQRDTRTQPRDDPIREPSNGKTGEAQVRGQNNMNATNTNASNSNNRASDNSRNNERNHGNTGSSNQYRGNNNNNHRGNNGGAVYNNNAVANNNTNDRKPTDQSQGWRSRNQPRDGPPSQDARNMQRVGGNTGANVPNSGNLNPTA